MSRAIGVEGSICAQATPSGRGGIGIVRVSGPLCTRIAEALLGALPPPRHALYGPIRSREGETLDLGIALYFPGPDSFTGEDVLELHCHGGPVLVDAVLAEVLALGARPARPGEFSERAFLNGKLDLAQAEAIADLIDSGSRQAARLALHSLQGEFSRLVHRLVAAITELRVYVEAAMDFPEEEVDFLADDGILQRLSAIRADLAALLRQAAQGRALREGLSVVIAGAPNAGKSSLLNALSGADSAIVTAIPGTTRDTLREEIFIDGMPLHVIDTAGLRDSKDPVEQEGIRRAWREIDRADRVLLVLDASTSAQPTDSPLWPELLATAGLERLTVLRNKIDLSGEAPSWQAGGAGAPEMLSLSARDGQGLDLLKEHLKRCAGLESGVEGRFMARRRHLDALERASRSLAAAEAQLLGARAGELLAEDLREAQQALGEITGEVSSDDLLGHIFSSFCIGK